MTFITDTERYQEELWSFVFPDSNFEFVDQNKILGLDNVELSR